MKDIKYYVELKGEYKSNEQLRNDVFEGFENFVGTQAQINDEKCRLGLLYRNLKEQQRNNKVDERKNLTTEFMTDLFKEHGVQDNPKAIKLFDKCYEIGYDRMHAYGYYDTYVFTKDIFETFVDYIK